MNGMGQRDRQNDPERELRITFANNLSLLIQQRGYTQAHVAEKTGISKSALSSYCKGVRYPRPDQVTKLAQFLGTSVSRLNGQPDEGDRISQLAYQIAASFDELDDTGQELVRQVVDHELKRVRGVGDTFGKQKVTK